MAKRTNDELLRDIQSYQNGKGKLNKLIKEFIDGPEAVYYSQLFNLYNGEDCDCDWLLKRSESQYDSHFLTF